MPTDQTALVALVPDAESVVGAHRLRLDGGVGVPAHVTILFPFVPPDLVDDELREQLTRVIRVHPSFEVTFDSVRWFGDQVAYLQPTPDAPFRRLTSSVHGHWPEFPPYAGTVDEPIPHLTIGDGGRTPELEAATACVSRDLPVSARITELHLMAGSTELRTWAPLMVIPLG